MMMESPALEELFERRLVYPDPDAQHRYAALVGMDDVKSALVKSLSVSIDRAGIIEWGKKYHGGAKTLLENVIGRPPLVVLAGDVGTGKTALAESVGDTVARTQNIGITLFPVSLSARGIGRVGEMTRLISAAFDAALQEAEKSLRPKGKPSAGVILLVDEADALVQSREMAQMHHEDRAGVNAFIRGVDRVAQSRASIAVIMCTNRLSAIDPAVRRRAANIFEFSRPNEAQRISALAPLKEAGFGGEQIAEIAKIIGERDGECGYTYSDIVQRLIPAIILDAYPERAVEFKSAVKIAQNMKPTPAFREDV